MSVPRALLLLLAALLASSAGCTEAFRNVQQDLGSRTGPGSNYEAYLTGDRKLVVELDHSPGALWDTSEPVNNHVRRQLERITAKDVEFRASEDLPDRGDRYRWSLGELRDLHEDHQDLSSNENRVVMHALFVDGRFEKDGTLGLSYASQAFALFTGAIESASCSNNAPLCTGGDTREWRVNRAVAVHEAGHLFGLVGSPLPMVNDHKMHEDPDPDTPEDEAGDSHSSNQDSVMYWAVNTRRGLTNIFGNEAPPHQFDREDLRDAENQRGGGG